MPASEPHHLSPKRGGSFVIAILSALRHTIHYRCPITTRTQAHRGHHLLSGRPRCVGLVPQRRVVVQQRHDLGQSFTQIPLCLDFC